MNRVKLTIQTEDGSKLLCKIGTSVPESKTDEYSDLELSDILKEMSDCLREKHLLTEVSYEM